MIQHINQDKEAFIMPRPKGSKNKKTAPVAASMINNIEEKIAVVEAEIAAINEQLKAKKDELKALVKEKAKADKAAAKQKAKEEAAAAAKKAEEDKAKLLEAFQASGKSVEELMAFMKGE